MIKKSFYLAFLFFCSFCLKAQEKISVAFIPMSFDEEAVSKMEVKIIQETIINSFVSSKRFTVVDRSNLESLEKEKKLQRTEAFMDSKDSFKDGISKGASYLIEGNILGIKHIDKKDKWSSSVTVQLKVLDVSTGEIITTESIDSEPVPEAENLKSIAKAHYNKDELKALENKIVQLNQPKSNSDASFKVALDRLSENVRLFAGKNFPMHIEIVEWIGKAGKSQSAQGANVNFKGPFKDFVIAAGSNLGINKGQLLDIVSLSSVNVGGKTINRQQKIGKAWVFSVDDGNFSSATVIDGEKNIKKAVADKVRFGVLTN
ncbi:CsgG/HfaB family protein [Pedobacter gandavensis]|uniref:CsgG/HfaB family protein n=1 Tax=Pedobacter gandavensis TaxID=2679963 RepID=UPI00292D4644|nr:CsgG/HfaB family protein [Pedobacter gandavensis]